MLGPLPLLHRIVTVAVALASGLLAGAWLWHVTPLAVPASVLVGSLLGLGASYLLVHPFGEQEPVPVRVDRRR